MLRGPLLMRDLIFAMLITWFVLVQNDGVRLDLILRNERDLLNDWFSIIPLLLFDRCRP
jgi:hypothetical protein